MTHSKVFAKPQEGLFQELIQKNISLADKNWFATGGPARFYAEPTTTQAFQDALEFANKHQLPVFVLGHGANILISDNGFDGLVVRPQLTQIAQQVGKASEVLVTASAGVSLHDLIDHCLQHQILGLEEFSGIPGTVGGSVYINVHYFEFLLEHFLVEGEVIHKKTGRVQKVNREWFGFGYNQSKLHKHDYYLLNATFTLKHASDIETACAKGRRMEIIRHRAKRYPLSHTCGSFFRNFHDDEVDLTVNEKKMIWVAYYLDKIGIKGNLRVGDAIVSYQHANMIVNCGNATTANIIGLACKMQELVKEEFGIIPQPECQLIGFKEYPLLQ